MGNEALARCIDLVKPLEEALPLEFGEDLARVPADEVTVAEQSPVSLVDELEPVLRLGQDRNEAGRLLEQPPLALRLGRQPPLGHDLPRDLGAGADEARNGATLIAHRRVGEGEVRLLRIAAPLHDEGNVVHVDGLTAIGLLDDGQEVSADLVPDLQEVAAQGGRMLTHEDLGIGIVVEQRAFQPPSDEHRLVRTQHHADQRFEPVRPAVRCAERRRCPVVGSDERTHLPTIREEVQSAVRSKAAVHRVRSSDSAS
jgi:hypothetical protein